MPLLQNRVCCYITLRKKVLFHCCGRNKSHQFLCLIWYSALEAWLQLRYENSD